METTAFAGLKNTVRAERLKAGELVLADNVDIGQDGQLSRRSGITKLLAGNYHSLFSDDLRACLVSGQQLLALLPNYTTTVLRDGLTPGATMAYLSVNERIYYSNEHETGVIEQGVSRSWGLVPPAHQGSASVVAGELPAGAYQWAVTYLRDDGQESGTGLAGSIELPVDSGIAFAGLPVSDDPSVREKLIYLSTANGAVLYEALTLSADDVAAQIISPCPAARPLATQFLGPPPPGQCLAHANGRMYVAAGHRLYYSEPYADELFDARHYLEFDGPVTLLAPCLLGLTGGLMVSAGPQTFLVAGNSPEDFTRSLRSNDRAIPGTLTYASGTLLGDGALGDVLLPLWLSEAGICYATPDGALRNLTATNYQMHASGQGAAVFMSDPARYLAILNR